MHKPLSVRFWPNTVHVTHDAIFRLEIYLTLHLSFVTDHPPPLCFLSITANVVRIIHNIQSKFEMSTATCKSAIVNRKSLKRYRIINILSQNPQDIASISLAYKLIEEVQWSNKTKYSFIKRVLDRWEGLFSVIKNLRSQNVNSFDSSTVRPSPIWCIWCLYKFIFCTCKFSRAKLPKIYTFPVRNKSVDTRLQQHHRLAL